MKKIIAALLLLPALAFGASNDLFINQRNSDDSGTLNRTITKPPGTQDGIVGYKGVTSPDVGPRPWMWTIGTGLAIQSDALVALPQAWASITGKPTFSPVATSGAYGDLTGRPTLFSGAYADLTGKPTTFAPAPHTHDAADVVSGTLATARIPALAISQTTGLQTALDGKFANPTGNSSQYVRGDGVLATLPPAGTGTVTSVTAGTGLSGGTITGTGTISLPNTGTAGTYANVTTDAQGRVTGGTTISQTAATRALNTAFQISTTRTALASYSVQLTVTASIAGGQTGDVILEIASDSGFTANVQTVAISGLGQTYTLAVAIQGVQPQTGVVAGVVPAGYYARLRTVNITGTPAFLVRAAQEVLL